MSYELELLGQIEHEMEKLASIHDAITGALMQKQANAVTELPMRAVSALKAKGQTMAHSAGTQLEGIESLRRLGGKPEQGAIGEAMLRAKQRLGGVLDAHAGKIVAGGGALGVAGLGTAGYQMAKSASDEASLLERIRGKLNAAGQSAESSAVNFGDAVKHHGIRSAPTMAGEGPVTGYGIDRARNAYSNAMIATGNAIKSHPRAALAAGTIGAVGAVGGIGYGGYQMAKSASEAPVVSKADALRAVLAANGLY